MYRVTFAASLTLLASSPNVIVAQEQQPLCFRERLAAQDAQGEDSANFGSAVDLLGDLMIVGDRSAWTGSCVACGAAHIFRRDGFVWRMETRLAPLDLRQGFQFGASVTIDQDLAVIGAPVPTLNCPTENDCGGQAWVYRYDGTRWRLEELIRADRPEIGDEFGRSVSLQGEVLLVGRPGQNRLCGPGHQGCNDAGIVQVHEFDGNIWRIEQFLEAPDEAPFMRFGQSVDISGELAIVGSPATESNPGSATVFRGVGGFSVEQLLLPDIRANGDSFGTAVAIDGDLAIVGAPEDDAFGFNVGTAYIFQFDGKSWIQVHSSAGDDAHGNYGSSVAIEGSTIIIGALRMDGVEAASGAVFVIRRNDNGTPGDASDDMFVREGPLFASEPLPNQHFGSSAAIHGSVVVVGAKQDECVEIEGRCGAVYTFSSVPCPTVPSVGGYSYDVAIVLLLGVGTLLVRRRKVVAA